MNALSIALKVNVNVAYLDGHDPHGQVSFVPFQNAPFTFIEPVNLLYRCVHSVCSCLRHPRTLSLNAPSLSDPAITTSSTGGTRIPCPPSSYDRFLPAARSRGPPALRTPRYHLICPVRVCPASRSSARAGARTGWCASRSERRTRARERARASPPAEATAGSENLRSCSAQVAISVVVYCMCDRDVCVR